MFLPDPFDIAPGAPRHAPAAWLVLTFGLAFAAACAVPFVAKLQAISQAEQSRTDARSLQKIRADAEAAARHAQADPAALARIKSQQALQNQLRMSWTSLFDALELATGEAKGGATVLSLAPIGTRADSAEIAITAMATSVPVMLAYVRSLQANEHIRQVQLTSQQPATNGGAATVRFQLTLQWIPVAASTVATAADAPFRIRAAR